MQPSSQPILQQEANQAALHRTRQRTSARKVTGSASWRNSCSTSAAPRTSTGDKPSLPTAACRNRRKRGFVSI